MNRPAIEVWLGERLQLTAFLTGDSLSIGRSPENDVVLDNISISRKHAELRAEGTGVTLVDLDSENGVRVNDRVVRDRIAVKVGDQISLGKYRLNLIVGEVSELPAKGKPRAGGPALPNTFDMADPEVAKARRALKARQALRKQVEAGESPEDLEPTARLDRSELERVPEVEVFEKGRLRVRKPVDGKRLTIGRSPDNDLVLQGDAVSRHHAVLREEGISYVIEDLKSANGIFVNDRKVDETSLKSGDMIGIGPYDLVFSLVERPL